MMAKNKSEFLPPGKLIDMGNHYRLHILRMGEGKPPVILECGSGAISLDWYPLQTEVSQLTSAYAYDRAGSGWSDASPHPYTIPQIVKDLHCLLSLNGVSGPYVLVGHSLGGLFVQYYARQYPKEVAGVILVDSSHPRIYQYLPPELARKERKELRKRWIYSLFHLLPAPHFENVPPDVQRVYAKLLARPSYWRSLISQNKYLNTENIVELFENAGPFPDIPVTVLTPKTTDWLARITPELPRLWLEAQKELANLSPRGQLIFVEGGHSIPDENPAAIIEAIQQMLIEVPKRA
jgi:pimeloyl-ACP methyl ester carboxylesterase